jgi:hypothetical protein
VGGVIGEAGPLDVAALPQAIDVALPGEKARASVALLGVPRLVDASGEPLAAGTRLDPSRDLQLTVAGPAASFLEIRPFGASRFVACPAGAGGRVTVPRELLEKISASSSHAALSFEAVWRDSRVLSGASSARLSLEVRSSAVLDLRSEAAEIVKPTAPIAP